MHAVIRTGGKQYRVAEGDVLRVETLAAEAGEKIELTDVLLIADGEQVQVGAPLVDGGSVTVEVQGHGRADKIEVIKFKRRKKYRRKQGHRQDYTELKITGIIAGGTRATAAEQAATPEEQPAADASPAPAATKPPAEAKVKRAKPADPQPEAATGAARAVAKSAPRAEAIETDQDGQPPSNADSTKVDNDGT